MSNVLPWPSGRASPIGRGRLRSVTTPDGVTRRYRYEDVAHPARFTATTLQPPGEDEVVVAQWEYDAG